jgi:DNA primase small subunit
VDVSQKRGMPSSDDGGWRRRMRGGMEDLLASLDGKEAEEGLALLRGIFKESKIEIGKKTLEGLYQDLYSGKSGQRGVDRMRAENTFEVFSEKRHADAFLSVVDIRVKGRMKGETDEPVTSDIKRLIRLPSSLHGKTGFEVVPMTREKLDTFDPFTDAVAAEFGDDAVKVVVEKAAKVTLKGQEFSLKEGENEVPEYVAVFLICRRLATIEY